MSQPLLAAVLYGAGEGATVDAVLAESMRVLRAKGLQLAGAVQHNTDHAGRCRCDMVLEDLATGRLVAISEDRGPEARGCHLDAKALEEAVGLSLAAVDGRAELLMVNRFGKREAAGHGFRQAVEAAVTRGIPVLTAVADGNLSDWEHFVAGPSVRLPPDPAAIVAWCLSVTRPVATGARPSAAETVLT